MKNLRAVGETSILLLASYAAVCFIQADFRDRLDFPLLGMKAFLLLTNVMLVAAPLVLLNAFVRFRRVLFIFFLGSAAFISANRLKITHLHEPLLFFDLYKVSTFPILIRYLGMSGLVLIALLVLGITALLVWRRGSGTFRFSAIRLAIAAPLTALFSIMVLEGAGLVTWLKPDFILNGFDPPMWTSKTYGYPVATVMSLKYLKPRTPAHYTGARIEELLKPFATPDKTPAQEPARDVVVILLESFKDFDADGVKARADMIPFYHRLKKESVSRAYLSPVYGGGTANAEFEVLTGLPFRYFPKGSAPYLQYIRNGTPSVAQWYQAHGYRTVAIHANKRGFWAREQAYPRLGVSEFIDIDDLRATFPGRDKPGDAEVFDQSIAMLKTAQGKPQFHFLLTIGTHGSYDADPKNRDWCERENEWMSCDAFNAYAEKMKALDSQLAAYFAELRKLPNPPAVILFGDHQPALTPKLNSVDWNGEAFHRVEALLWNHPDPLSASGAHVPFTCLSATISRAGGFGTNPFFRFIDRLCSNPRGSALLSQGELPEEYGLLVYDRIFGDRISEK